MLDLKAKLAAAGLVTQEQIQAAERKKDPKKKGGPPPGGRPAAPARSGLDLPALKKAGKGEIYEATRRVVDRSRLDPAAAIPSERAESFHFTTQTGQLGRLTLEPEIHTEIVEGRAAIVAFMGHHGLTHAVVPRVVAEDIAALMPVWLRVCKDHPAAGQIAPPPADKTADKTADKKSRDPG